MAEESAAVVEEEVENPKDASDTYEFVDLDDELRVRTHTELDPNQVGHVDHLNPDESRITLTTSRSMHADMENLVHSGYIGSSAEYAALIAVNEPNAMIYSVSSQYFACARVGDDVSYKATVKHSEGRKRDVTVVGKIESIKVYEAHIVVIIPEYHPLKIKLLDIAGAND
jgi:acyl-CoA thioesterase